MRCPHGPFFLNHYFVVGRPLLKNLSGCERRYTKEDSVVVFLLMARVSQLSSCRISVIFAQRLLLPKQNRVAFLAFEYRSRGRDPMRQLCIRGLVELRCLTRFLLLTWDRYYKLRRSTPTSLLHFTSNLFTSNSCDTFCILLYAQYSQYSQELEISHFLALFLSRLRSNKKKRYQRTFAVPRKTELCQVGTFLMIVFSKWPLNRCQHYRHDAGWRSYKSIKFLVLKQTANNFIADYHMQFCFPLQQSTHLKSNHQ